ncbi:hypothetical protein K469DRAFT_750126 [Zopfia rhizophila CBS 207.26]|uniref:ABC transporter domain-containing protein n=1 Tax=Zopfia rhizophila CBS 207.26 TaxID=1314779 RepID=A0A6A6E1Z1_9PEZI|nr:hypothetical protein K469DRAFT_750126 [Zopfia rhizophila CBS 207.26]
MEDMLRLRNDEWDITPPLDVSTKKADDGTSIKISNATLAYENKLRHHNERMELPPKSTGFAFRNLRIHGFLSNRTSQSTFTTVIAALLRTLAHLVHHGRREVAILQDVDGLVRKGETLLVLGRPGSGCSTLLKAIGGSTRGIKVDDASMINYQGVPPTSMHSEFRSDCIYIAELDVHFPELTVEETLRVAAEARIPASLRSHSSRRRFVDDLTDATISAFSLSSCAKTKLGNDIMRGVSGGERKRVTLAEAFLGGAAIQCWDNSTRGMDSSTALDFIQNLTTQLRASESAAAVSIYQCSQTIYDTFTKVTVLHKGKQIYFGPAQDAERYFVDMGFGRPSKTTSTADFLTALTHPPEASLLIRPGFEGSVPETAEDLATRWRSSPERENLLSEIADFEREYPLGGQAGSNQMQLLRKAKGTHLKRGLSRSLNNAFTLSLWEQFLLCLNRGMMRLRNQIQVPVSNVFANGMLALIVGSIFYNLSDTTASFYGRGVLVFFATMLNGFMSGFEVLTIWAQRPIVEKQSRLGFYQPVAEAVSAMVCDLPNKIMSSIFFNTTLYFMANLRRTPEAFFAFLLFSFVCLLTMSMFFRSIGSLCRTFTQTFIPVGLSMFMCIMYTGFVIPPKYMHLWFHWFNYINTLAYAFESLMFNEFFGRSFACAVFVPSGPEYGGVEPSERACATVGAVAGQDYVDGSSYLMLTYGYSYSHKWRNLGILFAMVGIFCAIHLVSAQYILAELPKGDILIHRHRNTAVLSNPDEEDGRGHTGPATSVSGHVPSDLEKQTSVVHWENLTYEVSAKRDPRQILHGIDGWVKPGTLTALMGATGAGKTTLLDVLANRITTGFVKGSIFVNGTLRQSDFQRNTGYSQQADIHVSTATVREALEFSACLRQPASILHVEKCHCADAIVGIPGEGLNVEQRRRLTIAVELAAKPELLLFLDEPTSGLDSRTAWSICTLLRKLADHGQAVLCTIHQPSASLLEMFDRLLLIDSGEMLYFGEVGPDACSVVEYFEKHGAYSHEPQENPSEWMFNVISHTKSEKNWAQIWRMSEEYRVVQKDLAELRRLQNSAQRQSLKAVLDYAAPFSLQVLRVTQRTFAECWRSPKYLWGKFIFYSGVSLLVGFSFWDSPKSLQGLQNQLFSVFLVVTTFSCVMQQTVPEFITRRNLFEAREKPSKTYLWKAFLLSSIITEVSWQTIASVLAFPLWYYPIGMHQNSSGSEQRERGLLMFLLTWSFFVFTSTLSYLVAASMDLAETPVNIAQLLFYLILLFCGVLASESAMPRFWIFMYRISPLTYQISAMFSAAVANSDITCSGVELLVFHSASGHTCGEYLASFTSMTGGRIVNPDSRDTCQFCPLKNTNAFLQTLGIYYSDRWWQFLLQLVLAKPR